VIAAILKFILCLMGNQCRFVKVEKLLINSKVNSLFCEKGQRVVKIGYAFNECRSEALTEAKT